jgi:L-lactate dehydrogenase complex protein LldE
MNKALKVSLFIPCFVDQFYPDVGASIVTVLERLGCEVDYPEGQTCCGQPAFNSGYWDEARKVAEHSLDVFSESEVIVSASGSCGAMMKVFYPELFKGTGRHFDALKLAPKIYEFSDFLVNKLGVRDVGARFPGTVTFHDGCHGLRELGIESQPRELLKHVRDLTLVEMTEAKTCCGFGGAFAVKFPMISTAMGEVKCASIQETKADYVVSNDSSCLMQIQGLLSRQGRETRCLHLAEILAKT